MTRRQLLPLLFVGILGVLNVVPPLFAADPVTPPKPPKVVKPPKPVALPKREPLLRRQKLIPRLGRESHTSEYQE